MMVLSGARRGLLAVVLPILVGPALGSTQGAAGARVKVPDSAATLLTAAQGRCFDVS